MGWIGLKLSDQLNLPLPCKNVARFDLVSIRLVVLCAERGSLALAAKSANMSKSTASQRLSNLEMSFGTQFFSRDHLGLHPTKAGSELVQYGRAILQTLDQLSERLAALDAADVPDNF